MKIIVTILSDIKVEVYFGKNIEKNTCAVMTRIVIKKPTILPKIVGVF